MHAEPAELLLALHRVTTAEGHLTCAIYRASAAVHRHLTPLRRRQVLATDAARFAATHQHHALAAPLHWPPRWATGQQANSALHTTITGHEGSVVAVACSTTEGRPVAVTLDNGTVRVWDLTTAALRATLSGHEHPVYAVACCTVEGRPVAVTAGDDKTVRVWDLTAATELAVFDYAGYMRGALCIEPAQEIVIGAGWDLTVIDRRPCK